MTDHTNNTTTAAAPASATLDSASIEQGRAALAAISGLLYDLVALNDKIGTVFDALPDVAAQRTAEYPGKLAEGISALASDIHEWHANAGDAVSGIAAMFTEPDPDSPNSPGCDAGDDAEADDAAGAGDADIPHADVAAVARKAAYLRGLVAAQKAAPADTADTADAAPMPAQAAAILERVKLLLLDLAALELDPTDHAYAVECREDAIVLLHSAVTDLDELCRDTVATVDDRLDGLRDRIARRRLEHRRSASADGEDIRRDHRFTGHRLEHAGRPGSDAA